MLWTEKYRPKTLRDVKGQEHFVLDAELWIEEKNMPNVLLYGNAGCGKTAAGLALARTMLGEYAKDNFVEVNASDDRRLEVVRTTIKNVAQSGTIGDVPFRICLLDEMDGMTTDAQNALKRIMERYSGNIRFIITCNDKTKIRLIYALDGDLRRAITEIQAAKASGNSLTKQIESSLEEYDKILMLILNKNPNDSLKHLHNLIYEGRNVKELCLGLHNAVINSKELDNLIKFKLLRTIGESEWRSTTMTPKVLVSWMVGQLI